jgi:hypothetical protein
MAFQLQALARHRFTEIFSLDDEELARRGMKRYIADRTPGFPCRVSLQDAEPGERVILIPFQHQRDGSPYQALGPIFVREAAQDANLPPDTVPALLRSRLLSLRAYDSNDLMFDANVIEGRNLEGLVAKMLANSRAEYLHVHFARPGCYACRIDRLV